MTSDTDPLARPVGAPVTGAFPRPRPAHVPHIGRYVRLDPMRRSDGEGLFDAFAQDPDGLGWTYLPIYPWADVDAARQFCTDRQASADPMFYTLRDTAGIASGFCSLLRIAPEIGSIEVGYIHFAPRAQQTAMATEAMALLMRHAFDDLGYRRYEWKCDALNAPSRAAAARLGFTYEGTFRQASITKGRNRDTAWFSILDHEWPALREAFDAWLDPANFDGDGRQIRSLSDFRA